MGTPAYPNFVAPYVPASVSALETDDPGLISTVRAFLEGTYDPTSQMFKSYLSMMRNNQREAADDLRDDILAAQGGQRIYGAAAGKQLNRALVDKVRDDLDREQHFLWDTLNQVISNRRLGLDMGQDILNSSRQYALEKARMENEFNAGTYKAAVQQQAYRKATANTARNFLSSLNPYITSGTQLLSKIFFPSS